MFFIFFLYVNMGVSLCRWGEGCFLYANMGVSVCCW